MSHTHSQLQLLRQQHGRQGRTQTATTNSSGFKWKRIQTHRHGRAGGLPARAGCTAVLYRRVTRHTYGPACAGQEAYALLNEIAEYAAGISYVSRKLFMKSGLPDLSTTLCRGAEGCRARHSHDADAGAAGR